VLEATYRVIKHRDWGHSISARWRCRPAAASSPRHAEDVALVAESFTAIPRPAICAKSHDRGPAAGLDVTCPFGGRAALTAHSKRPRMALRNGLSAWPMLRRLAVRLVARRGPWRLRTSRHAARRADLVFRPRRGRRLDRHCTRSIRRSLRGMAAGLRSLPSPTPPQSAATGLDRGLPAPLRVSGLHRHLRHAPISVSPSIRA